MLAVSFDRAFRWFGLAPKPGAECVQLLCLWLTAGHRRSGPSGVAPPELQALTLGALQTSQRTPHTSPPAPRRPRRRHPRSSGRSGATTTRASRWSLGAGMAGLVTLPSSSRTSRATWVAQLRRSQWGVRSSRFSTRRPVRRTKSMMPDRVNLSPRCERSRWQSPSPFTILRPVPAT